MKIILIGYMGCGKSTIGKSLATKKNIPFIDLDMYIEEKEKSSVQEIFKSKGEIYFRKIETKYLNELLATDSHFVLALGGGTPCFANNMAIILEKTSNVFYLKYNPKSLTDRLLLQKNHRPLIADIANTELEEFIRKHLFERSSYYNQANYIISMDNLTIEQSLELIESKLE